MLSDWQVQEMKEAEDARIWEELNAPDPAESEMKAAAKMMAKACELLGNAEDYLVDAVDDLYGTDLDNRVESMLNDLEQLNSDIRKVAEQFGKGVRD